MIIDMRYYLASLVAVFFALGLGILIGTSLSSDGRFVAEQANLLDAIEAQLVQFKNEIAQLELDKTEAMAEINFYQQFAESVLPILVNGQLRGVKINLLDYGPKSSSIVEKVTLLAGADVTKIKAEAVKTTSLEANSLYLLVGEPPFALEVRNLAQSLHQRGARFIAVGDQEWLRGLNIPNIVSVSRIDTAVGQVQLVSAIKEKMALATKE
jgi:hypothetical protein